MLTHRTLVLASAAADTSAPCSAPASTSSPPPPLPLLQPHCIAHAWTAYSNIRSARRADPRETFGHAPKGKK